MKRRLSLGGKEKKREKRGKEVGERIQLFAWKSWRGARRLMEWGIWGDNSTFRSRVCHGRAANRASQAGGFGVRGSNQRGIKCESGTLVGGDNGAGHPRSLDQTQAGPLGDENPGFFLELPFRWEAGMSPPYCLLSSFAAAAASKCCCPASVIYSVTLWSRSPCGKSHVLPLWMTHTSVGCHMMEFGVEFLFASKKNPKHTSLGNSAQIHALPEKVWNVKFR